MRTKQLLALLFVATLHCVGYCQIYTPSIIDDNMVVRRNSTARIWGWSGASENVYIVADWNLSDTICVRSDPSARFEAEIPTPEAGGPYTIKIMAGGDQRVITNVMVGEVWLCSGQSNMQMSMACLYGTQVDYGGEFATLNNPMIRTFKVHRVGADTPQNDCRGSWDAASATSISDISLTAYFFAKRLQQELGIPIGIVVSAWGGTSAEVWLPERAMEQNPEIEPSAELISTDDYRPFHTARLYNSMIAPLVPFNFSGTIWYQGEGNIVSHQYYDGVMRSLIDSWREDFNPDMPFYFVQIAPFFYNGTSSKRSPYLREVQYQTSKYDNCGMVVINDLLDNPYNIHPANKPDVGARLADMALSRHYAHQGYDCSYPEIISVVPNGKKIAVELSNCQEGITLSDAEYHGFEIASQDGQFHKAKVRVEAPSTLILESKEVKSPVYVRYLFDDGSLCGVHNQAGLPLVPFRNDDIPFQQ